MSVLDSIKEAKNRGASDDQILGEILKQNPDKAGVFQEAQKRGAGSKQIVDEIITQNTPSTVEKVGKGVGKFLAEATGLMGLFKAGKETLTTKRPLSEILPEAAGSAAKLGLTLGSFGAATPLTLGGKIGLSAGVGAGFGGAEAIERGKGATDIAKSAGFGALAGGALGAAGAGLGAIARNITVKTPRQLVNFALKTPSKKADKGIAEAFLNRNLGGKSLESIERITAQEADDVGRQIQGQLTGKKTFVVNEFLADAKNAINQRTKGKISIDMLKQRLSGFVPDHAYLLNKPKINEKELNILRMAIDNNLKEPTFLGKALTNEQKAVKMFSDITRRTVQKVSNTQTLFKKQSEAIRIRDLAREAFKKSETQGRPGLLDISAAGVGGLVGGVPGAVAGVATERALRSTTVQGGLAQGLKKLGGLDPILRKLAPAERTIILNLIGRQVQSK